MKKSEEEWTKQLDAETYQVLRKKATERSFTGKYLHNKENGMYVCAGCGAPLFSSDTKFDSGTAWPSFWPPAYGITVLCQLPLPTLQENLREDRFLRTQRIVDVPSEPASYLRSVESG